MEALEVALGRTSCHLILVSFFVDPPPDAEGVEVAVERGVGLANILKPFSIIHPSPQTIASILLPSSPVPGVLLVHILTNALTPSGVLGSGSQWRKMFLKVGLAFSGSSPSPIWY